MSESTQLVYPPLKEQKKQNIETFIEQKSKSMICPELTFDENQDQIKQELLIYQVLQGSGEVSTLYLMLHQRQH